MIWAIAIRNLWQHKTKTLIIGALVSLGIMLTFAGNALIDSMIRNISGIFTEYYTGDILITSTETLGAGVFGAQSDDAMGFPVIPLIRDYDKVMEKVSDLEGVAAVTRQLSGYAMFNLDKAGMDYGLFFGVESESYFSVMKGIQLVSGRLLEPGEKGMILGEVLWKRFKDQHGLEVKPGDTIQLNSYGLAGMKIIELPVVGVYRFPQGNERFFPVSFVDAPSLRYLLGRSGGVAEKVEVTAEATEFLDMDLDSLFSDDSFGEVITTGPASQLAPDSPAQTQTSSKEPANDATAEAAQNESWHFIVIRTEKGADINGMISRLNHEIDGSDLLARAQGWWVSAMPDSATYSGVQLLFNVALFILAFVSIIIIMNTLVVSVMERTSEIGTMRALGAQKSFVSRMFIAETGFITLVFGLIGLAMGGAIILILNRIGLPTDNDALRFLGGGAVLRPTVSAQPIIMACVLMGVIGLFSWIYPVMIALKVSPLKAIATE